MGDLSYPDDIRVLNENYPRVISFNAAELAIEVGNAKA